MMELTKLFSPGNIGKMELKNRLVMAPTLGIAPFHGVPLPEGAKEDYIPRRTIDYFVERAKGGVALILGQSCRKPQQAPSEEGKKGPSLPPKPD